MNTDFIEELATVQKIKNSNLCIVRIEKTEKCDGCKACAFGRNNHIDVPATNSCDCKEGDKVLVRSFIKKAYVPALVVYGIPILMILITVLITSMFLKEWLVIVCSVVAFGISLLIIAIIEKLISKKFMATIIRKVD